MVNACSSSLVGDWPVPESVACVPNISRFHRETISSTNLDTSPWKIPSILAVAKQENLEWPDPDLQQDQTAHEHVSDVSISTNASAFSASRSRVMLGYDAVSP